MAKKKVREEGDSSTWMNTYSDLVTLLLTFFIMLFSMSSVEEEKWEMLIKAFTNKGNETSQIITAPEGEGDDMAANQGEAPLPSDGTNIDTTTQLPTDFAELYEYLKAYTEQNNMQSSISVAEGANGSVYIRFQDNLFFNPDRYEIKQEGIPVLEFLGNCLKNVEDQIDLVNINAHTAAVPEMPDYPVDDFRLSGERAASVSIYLSDEKGINPKLLRAIGFGKNFPIADNNTPEGRSQNRRVDMLLIQKNSGADVEQQTRMALKGTFDESKYPTSGAPEDIYLPEIGYNEAGEVQFGPTVKPTETSGPEQTAAPAETVPGTIESPPPAEPEPAPEPAPEPVPEPEVPRKAPSPPSPEPPPGA